MTIGVRTLKVSRTKTLSPHLKRITLGCDDLKDFPTNAGSGYVKVLFDAVGRVQVDLSSAKTAVNRSFTIRAFRAAERGIDIDFVLHDELVPASSWSRAASVTDTDTLSIAVPRPIKLANPRAG